MKLEELMKNGIKIGDNSIVCSGFMDGTPYCDEEYYYYYGDVYVYKTYDNRLCYNGESGVYYYGSADTFRNYVLLDNIENFKHRNQYKYRIFLDILHNLDNAIKLQGA